MINITLLTEYDADIAEAMGKLLCDLSSSHDGSAVSREIIEEIVDSPLHDILLAFDDDKLVGMASLSVICGALIGRNMYLEDFVVSKECQGKGIGKMLWSEMLEWGRRKGCRRFEFTSSGKGKKAGAVEFYKRRGAEIRDTNCFRVEL